MTIPIAFDYEAIAKASKDLKADQSVLELAEEMAATIQENIKALMAMPLVQVSPISIAPSGLVEVSPMAIQSSTDWRSPTPPYYYPDWPQSFPPNMTSAVGPTPYYQEITENSVVKYYQRVFGESQAEFHARAGVEDSKDAK